MAHEIYTTEGIVLGGHNFGEANRWYFILTPTLGLVTVRAQGVRLGVSKLRGHLPLFGHAEVSLVRGRDSWLLTGAAASGRYAARAAAPAARLLAARISSLLRRFLPEAEGNQAVFAEVDQAFARLSTQCLTGAELETTEIVLIWRLLHALGYIAGPMRLGRDGAPLALEELIRDINQALTHSHL
jgi:DNA repair protein RecO (recombination protein O)